MNDNLSSELIALQNGDVEMRGEFLWGSNYTFLVNVTFQEKIIPAVYKPNRGVRPLWDFPQGSLARREVAAYIVSEALGWGLVPPTVYRQDAPLGPGSLQLFIEHDPEYHYFNFRERDLERLRPVVLYDVLINNADRKGSHLIIDKDDQLWLIDHGVCFHVTNKLRTVIWDYVGESIPEILIGEINNFRQCVASINGEKTDFVNQLANNLSSTEIYALNRRVDDLALMTHFPAPDPNRRHYPWPQI